MNREIEDEFDKAVEIRQEINGVLWKDYQALSIVFGAIFGEDSGLLKRVSDLNYYKGGYPSESSPPKIESIFKSIGKLAVYFNAVGRLDEINAHLLPLGLKISTTTEISPKMSIAALGDGPKVLKALKRVRSRYDDFRVTDSPITMIEWFLDKTLDLQAEICERADEIKITIFDKVEVLDGSFDKGGFVGAVNKVANKKNKRLEGKDTESMVEAAMKKAETMRANGTLLEETIVR